MGGRPLQSCPWCGAEVLAGRLPDHLVAEHSREQR